MMEVIRLHLTPNGSGVATAVSPNLSGLVMAVDVVYASSSAAGTDVTIATTGVNAPAVPILTLTNNNTSVRKRPQEAVHDTSGTALSNQYSWIAICDTVTVSVAQATQDKTVTVSLYILP